MKTVIKILLLVTLPIWGIPFLFVETLKSAWEAISDYVDENIIKEKINANRNR